MHLGPLSIGRALHASLPEDRFDTGPASQGDLRLVADVRLDNRDELSARLGIPAARLARMSDSALLLECLLRWKEDALPKLAGEFALAWWDGSREQLHLARDIMGMRPLHYREDPRFFAFSSMPSGLHALPMVAREPDYDFLAEHVALLPQSPDGTFWKGLKRVPPGHLMTVTRTGIRRRPFWEASQAPDSGPTGAEAEEGLREVLDRAVAAQLRSSRKTIATHLSSGLDSSIVTATAARLHAPNEILAFTAVPPNEFDGFVPKNHYASEGELAAHLAAQYPNVRHRLIEGSTTSPVGQLDAECAYMQQPPANLCNLGWLNDIYREARASGADTLLMAAGGNATISYSGSEWLPYLLRRGRLLELAKVVGSLKAEGNSLRGLSVEVAGPFAPSFLWRAALRRLGHPDRLSDYSALHPRSLSRIRRLADQRGFDLLYRPYSDPTKARLAMCTHSDGGNSIKAVLARWGISLRDPTTDKRVIEYCLRLPYKEFLRGGVRRSLARRAFRDRVPASILNNRKRGYQGADWEERLAKDRSEISTLIESLHGSPAAGGTIDPHWLKRALAEWEAGAVSGNDAVIRIRGGLLRGVSAAHFIKRAEGANQ